MRAGELSESIGFLVSSPYNFSSEEKAGNYKVQTTTIIKGLKIPLISGDRYFRDFIGGLKINVTFG